MSSILGLLGSTGSIGRASVDLVLNSAQYDAQLSAAEAKTKSASGGLAGAFAAIPPQVKAIATAVAIAGVAIAKAVGVTQEWAAEVLSLQRVTGQTAESASALAAAGNVLGVSVQQMNIGFGLLEKNIVNASTNLTKYGIATQDASGNTLPFDTVLQNVIAKFQTLQPGADQAAFAMNVFGRSGKALIPILQQGQAGLAQLEAQAKAAGLVLSQDDVNASLALSKAQRALGEAFKGAAVQIGRVFIPLITPVVEGFTKMVEGAIKLGIAIGHTLAPYIDQVKQAFDSFMQAIQPLLPPLEQLGKLLGGAFLGAILGFVILQIKALVVVFDLLTQAVNIVIDAINIFIAGINKVIEASNALLGTHFQQIDALQHVTSATDAAAAATDHYGKGLGNAINFTGQMAKAQQGLTSAVKSAGDGILSLTTTVKDTFNISQKEFAKGFQNMLASAVRFREDMRILSTLKIGLDAKNTSDFETFLVDAGPKYVDHFVNLSAARQRQFVSDWQHSFDAVAGGAARLNNTTVTIGVNTSQIDSAAQKLHGLQAALARGL